MLTRGIVITSKNLITLTTFHAHYSNFITFKGPATLKWHSFRTFIEFSWSTETHSKPCQTSTMKLFAKTVNGLTQIWVGKIWSNTLWIKIFITPEPVMIFTLNLELYLKLRKKSTIKSKELDDDVILTNYDPIITFLIY